MKKQGLVICLLLFGFLSLFHPLSGKTDPILVDTNPCKSDADCKTDIPCNIDICRIEEGQTKGLCFHIPAECAPPDQPPPPPCLDEDPCTEDLVISGRCVHRKLETPECQPPPPPPPPVDCDDQNECTLDVLTENGCEHRMIPNCPAPLDPCSPLIPRTLAISCDPPPPAPKNPDPESAPDPQPSNPAPLDPPLPSPANNTSVPVDYLQGSGGCSLQKFGNFR